MFHPPAPADYVGNPPGASRTSGAASAWEQPLLGVGGYATAWQEQTAGSRRQMFVSVALDRQSSTAAVTTAAASVTAAIGRGVDALALSHQNSWHDLYKSHFLSIPDGRFE